ncbi:MAG: hypothetical protein WCF39_11280, partial [Pseudolabrys sp.]
VVTDDAGFLAAGRAKANELHLKVSPVSVLFLKVRSRWSAHHAWPRAGSNPPLQGAGTGAAEKAPQDQAFASVRVVVGRVMARQIGKPTMPSAVSV